MILNSCEHNDSIIVYAGTKYPMCELENEVLELEDAVDSLQNNYDKLEQDYNKLEGQK